jgi:hypothetical protein
MIPQRFRLLVPRSVAFYLPPTFEPNVGQVVPLQGIGLIAALQPERSPRGVEIITIVVEATAIRLLTPADARRWVEDRPAVRAKAAP